MASRFMASKFMANAAFEARLLLRPSHQRTVFRAVNTTPGRPTLPPILSSRSYSDSTSAPTPPFPESSGPTSTPSFPKSSGSTSTPPFPKSSGSTSTPPFPKSSGSISTPSFRKSSRSTKGSQSSRSKDKNRFQPRRPVSNTLVTNVLWALGGSFLTALFGVGKHIAVSYWGDKRQASQITTHKASRESAMYENLKKGPVFPEEITHVIPRKALVEEMKEAITPTEEGSLYSLIIGEHGTGKSSLIQLAVNDMDEPKGVVYVDIPLECQDEDNVIKAVQNALGWSPDRVIDSKDPMSLGEVLRDFTHLAVKYQQEYKKVPVLIIDNANRLAQKQPRLLELFQYYAKHAADKRTATVVFMSSEGRVPSQMRESSSWSRNGVIIEIGDVSKEEALQYLKLREIDKKQAAQIYELVGGRMIHLRFMADNIKKNYTLEALRKQLFSNAKSELKSAEILPDLTYHEKGAKIVRELLKEGSISEDAYDSLAGHVIGETLLKKNVFAFHYNSREITFQSAVMKRCCEKESASWKANE